MIISHEITSPSKCGGVINVSTITPKNIMLGFRMLAFKLWRGRVHPKTFESFLLSPKILFENIFELTHISKTEPKSCLKFFQINIKKLDQI